ncbi:MAG TPA: hypothetical protein DCQ64_13700 [Candidatus Rokubacteria bacterium]|nr:hypothetical protein [Candidatus Rokubacteria bacterium]
MTAPQKTRQVREGQRDAITLVVGAVVTLVSKVFEIDDPEAIGAMTTLLIIMCHRTVPDMAARK